MIFRTAMLAAALAVVGAGANVDCAAQTTYSFGQAGKLGNGFAKTYAIVRHDGKVTAIGIVFKERMLEGLPTEPNRTSRCFDMDNNGRIDDRGECGGDYEVRLSLPDSIADRTDVPFRWAAVNWSPHGHPPAAWSAPHFDFHFYMADRAEVDAIRAGPCQFFINCEDRDRALKPVPAKYIHPDHVSVGAAVPMMGNHLIDSKAPELMEKVAKLFTHTWIFGAYDGYITFYEQMIARSYLLTRPTDGCTPIKQPAAWERTGYYPTVYCLRHSKKHGTFTVSLEGMRFRQGE